MIFTPSLLPVWVRSLLCAGVVMSGVAQAQSTTPPAPMPQPSASATVAADPSARHIRIEDAGNRIDELRVGAETRSITVQPQGNLPSYQVEPTTGERRWKVLGF